MIEQIVIGLCGIASVYLSQDPAWDRRKWACIFGMFAQPFWLYATYQAGQWGIFLLSFVYAIGWARGIKTYWWRK